MKLRKFRPIKWTFVSQRFGDNKPCIHPVSRHIHSPLDGGACRPGYTKFYPFLGMKGHNGIDRPCPNGTPVYHCADFDGWAKLDTDKDGGIGVDVVSTEPLLLCNEGCKAGTKHYIKWRAWHLERQMVKQGEQVLTGRCIGLADNTGASSGPHLHEALKWCDEYGEGIHNGKNGWADNGYYGAINEDKHPDIEIHDHLFVLHFMQLEAVWNIKQFPREILFVIVQFFKSWTR